MHKVTESAKVKVEELKNQSKMFDAFGTMADNYKLAMQEIKDLKAAMEQMRKWICFGFRLNTKRIDSRKQQFKLSWL